MYKTTFFNKNRETLTDMNNIISSNPNTWPDIIRNKYGIIIDDHFWENNPLLILGSGIDIHKKQLTYNPETGEVTEWKVKPYNKVDGIAAYHDICYDMGKKQR